MPLQSAEVSMESAQEGGQMWHHITLTSYLDGVSHDSGVYKAISTIAIGLGAGNDRFRAVLRTADITLAQEWVAILKYACGFQRERDRTSKIAAARTRPRPQIRDRSSCYAPP